MLLCAYVVNGTPVNEMTSFSATDLSGNDPYKISVTVPAGYQDVSSIEFWWYMYNHQNGVYFTRDYKFIRNEIIILAYTTGWVNLSTAEKELVASIFAVGKTERDEIYTIEEQIQLGMEHHHNSTRARNSRLELVRLNIFNRIGKTDQDDISEESQDLLIHYIEEGREGTVEGDVEGLFDYIDGDSRTGTTWDGTGAGTGLRNKTYTIEGYTNCSDFADYILEVLKNGIY